MSMNVASCCGAGVWCSRCYFWRWRSCFYGCGRFDFVVLLIQKLKTQKALRWTTDSVKFSGKSSLSTPPFAWISIALLVIAFIDRILLLPIHFEDDRRFFTHIGWAVWGSRNLTKTCTTCFFKVLCKIKPALLNSNSKQAQNFGAVDHDLWSWPDQRTSAAQWGPTCKKDSGHIG